MLRSTSIARVRNVKGLSLYGACLPVVYDLNLLLEVVNVRKGPEEVEIRQCMCFGAPSSVRISKAYTSVARWQSVVKTHMS